MSAEHDQAAPANTSRDTSVTPTSAIDRAKLLREGRSQNTLAAQEIRRRLAASVPEPQRIADLFPADEAAPTRKELR